MRPLCVHVCFPASVRRLDRHPLQHMIVDRTRLGCRVAGWLPALLQGRSLQRLARSCWCGCGRQRLGSRGLRHPLSASRLQGCQHSWQPASLSRQACKHKRSPWTPLCAACRLGLTSLGLANSVPAFSSPWAQPAAGCVDMHTPLQQRSLLASCCRRSAGPAWHPYRRICRDFQ